MQTIVFDPNKWKMERLTIPSTWPEWTPSLSAMSETPQTDNVPSYVLSMKMRRTHWPGISLFSDARKYSKTRKTKSGWFHCLKNIPQAFDVLMKQ